MGFSLPCEMGYDNCGLSPCERHDANAELAAYTAECSS